MDPELLRPVLPVSARPLDLSGPPMDGDEFLRLVRRVSCIDGSAACSGHCRMEAEQIPDEMLCAAVISAPTVERRPPVIENTLNLVRIPFKLMLLHFHMSLV